MPRVLLIAIFFLTACTHRVPYALSDKDQARFVDVARIPPAKPGAATQIFGIEISSTGASC